VIGYCYNGGKTSVWPGEPAPQWVLPKKFADGPTLTLACDLKAWAAPPGWVIAPHGKGGPAMQGIDPFIDVTKLTTSPQVGAQGGNVLLLDGSVHWKNISQMTNYWAYQGGGYFNMW